MTHHPLSLVALASFLLTGCAARSIPDLPGPISNNAVAAVDGPGGVTLYSFMGIADPNDTSTITQRAHTLAPNARAWTRIADVPGYPTNDPDNTPRGKIGASAVTIAGEVYVIGGYAVLDDGTEVTEPRLLRYDPERDAYDIVSRVPVEVDDTLAAVWRDRYLVLVSGWHGPAHDNVPNTQLYDTRTGAWTQGTPLPVDHSGLFGHAGGITGDTLLVIDGVKRTPDGFVIANDVFRGRLDPDRPAEIVWTTLDPHPGRPTYRAGANTAASHDGAILILGGTDNPYNISGIGYNNTPSRPLPQLLRFDPASLTFTAHAAPNARMDLRGILPVGGQTWATIGGMTEPGLGSSGVDLIVTDTPPLP